ncbi:enoyl-CoA hydratase/isomerase family protein [Roseomonas haemaphysalidis]|uniref:Enoyl-CoA hydratase/isomerase family protein n=1 Tax=Roseomonas haemaphysalidis TaxID=2768162 RepID=A0ABS3KUY9_9PROT|nr:enoyl-CoA hydratase/isomerase family protein [Roseomonas haemaphysalidis]MBO1081300.1 enoyl-CoA hydratase/isomerase family protein [Roseomonas haemaphysalidis]
MTGLLARAEGAIGILTLARPARRNALRPEDRVAMLAALRHFEATPAIRAILIKAEGRDFCTGMDLGTFQALRQEPAALAAFLAEGHALATALDTSPLPVVAAVQGLCLAGGLELALCCDIVLAAEDARFGDQHARYGLLPAWGGTQRLPRAIGRPRALDLMLTGRWISAAEAAQWGLVSRVLPTGALAAEARACCAALAAGSAPALAAMKRLARHGSPEAEAEAAMALLPGADAAEGLSAFSERRQPVFAEREKAGGNEFPPDPPSFF